jgi:hypothetical protein
MEAWDMKLFKICILIFFFALSYSCASHRKHQKAEIENDLLISLSRDLAEIDIMVENARNEFKSELLSVKVLKPWKDSPGEKFAKITASKTTIFDLIAKSKIEVPTAKGFAIAEVLKLKTGKNKFIAVVTPEMKDTPYMAAAPKTTIVEGYPIKIYDPALAWDQKASKAITQYVSLTRRLEKKARQILDKLTELKKKYMDSLIYIEGFTISFPVLSVEIQFKFK